MQVQEKKITFISPRIYKGSYIANFSEKEKTKKKIKIALIIKIKIKSYIIYSTLNYYLHR